MSRLRHLVALLEFGRHHEICKRGYSVSLCFCQGQGDWLLKLSKRCIALSLAAFHLQGLRPSFLTRVVVIRNLLEVARSTILVDNLHVWVFQILSLWSTGPFPSCCQGNTTVPRGSEACPGVEQAQRNFIFASRLMDRQTEVVRETVLDSSGESLWIVRDRVKRCNLCYSHSLGSTSASQDTSHLCDMHLLFVHCRPEKYA